jgi:hypothetical protein
MWRWTANPATSDTTWENTPAAATKETTVWPVHSAEKGKKHMALRTTQRATFRIVVDGDLDNPLPITAIEDFPDFLGGYRESIFAQMSGEDYYKSQLVLRSREGDLITYDFYSEQAWIDEMVESQVKERLEPYERAEREDEMNREIERRVQERMAEETLYVKSQNRRKKEER